MVSLVAFKTRSCGLNSFTSYVMPCPILRGVNRLDSDETNARLANEYSRTAPVRPGNRCNRVIFVVELAAIL